jgi:indole-3-glycerol phosphate synthase
MKAEMQQSGVLTTILRDTARRVTAELPLRGDWEARARSAPKPRPFAAAFTGPDVGVIAEVKRRSPSQGTIHKAFVARPVMAAIALAEAYGRGGASAISVLTEPDHFDGSLNDLAEVSSAVSLPTLRKDFIIDPIQVYQARAAGASAILLIVRALTASALKTLASLAREIGLSTLVEIHSGEELDAAMACEPTAIGVNSRDLETLLMNPVLHEQLIPRIPSDVIAVAESGLKSRADIERVAQFGANAVLVGTSVAGADGPEEAVRALTAVRKRPR